MSLDVLDAFSDCDWVSSSKLGDGFVAENMIDRLE